VRPVSYGIVDTDAATVEFLGKGELSSKNRGKETYNSVELLDATTGLVDGRHFDKTKTTRAVRLCNVKTCNTAFQK
jgi:hypothetical protein